MRADLQTTEVSCPGEHGSCGGGTAGDRPPKPRPFQTAPPNLQAFPSPKLETPLVPLKSSVASVEC